MGADRGPGRPRKTASLETCCRVLAAIAQAAGRITIRALKELCPDASRAWLANVLRRDVRARAARRRARLATLTWRRVGTVWAMDFTALEGREGPHAMYVRDLAAGKSLYAGVVPAESAQAAVAVLVELFGEHGAPLVIKCDNGGAFRSAAMRELLRQHQALVLFSPPRTPSYNGACESGIGVLKRVAVDLCAGDDPAGSLAAYLQPAVEIVDGQPVRRERGAPTRSEAWQGRRPCPAKMRRRLLRLHARYLSRYRAVDGIAPGAPVSDDEQASLDRRAIRDALCDMNLLTIQRP